MIRSFKCSDTEALSKGERVRRFVNIAAVARRKLRQLQIAGRLDDLRVPPGNRLEALKGKRQGQHASVSMTNGAFASVGSMQAPRTLRSWTITEEINYEKAQASNAR